MREASLYRNGAITIRQFRPHSRDSEIVTSSQGQDLSYVPEWRSHDDGLVTKFLVVVVDPGHWFNPGVILWSKRLLATVLDVPVKDATNEWRDESNSSLGTGHCLRRRGQKRVNFLVAKDPTHEQNLPCILYQRWYHWNYQYFKERPLDCMQCW